MLRLGELHHPALIDLTPGIRSLQLHFDPAKLPQRELLELLARLAEELKNNRITRVPARMSWDDPATRLAIEKYVSTVRPRCAVVLSEQHRIHPPHQRAGLG